MTPTCASVAVSERTYCPSALNLYAKWEMSQDCIPHLSPHIPIYAVHALLNCALSGFVCVLLNGHAS